MHKWIIHFKNRSIFFFLWHFKDFVWYVKIEKWDCLHSLQKRNNTFPADLFVGLWGTSAVIINYPQSSYWKQKKSQTLDFIDSFQKRANVDHSLTLNPNDSVSGDLKWIAYRTEEIWFEFIFIEKSMEEASQQFAGHLWALACTVE